MNVILTETAWDYQLLDSGAGFRLEKWGQNILVKPDPQAIWFPSLPETEWAKCNAEFKGQNWKKLTELNEPWLMQWQDLKLYARLTPFKHTGIFPEQAANWEWLEKQVKSYKIKNKNNQLRILNLFGYTGASSVLLAKLGCEVTHVDASKPAIAWAKENQKLNQLPQDSIRWILDDVSKFVKREIKRGQLYHGIIMDPPAFGHSPQGKTWKFSEDFPKLLEDCQKIMSPLYQFFLINAYATNTSRLALQNLFEDVIQPASISKIECGELCLKQKSGRLLSTGITLRY